MATFKGLMKDPKSLTDEQILEMLSLLEVEKSKRNIEPTNKIKPSKETKPIIACPHCGCIGAVKCGLTAAGTQRYKCKECGKTFTESTGTIVSNSRLTKEQWIELIRGMVSRLSLSKIADNIGMSVKAAWYNKHKIQMVLTEIFKDQDQFKGIVECDECSVHLSFKGKRDPEFFIFTLGRMPRHHRCKSEKIEYLVKNGLWDRVQSNPELLDELLYGKQYLQGTNKDSVSILSGKDIAGDLYMNPACLGNIESRHVIQGFQNRFEENSILVTDGSEAYTQFAELENIHHIQVQSTDHAKGPYSLAHINSVHSNLRDYWPKNGQNLLATKYIDLGLIFFWWQEKNKDLSIAQQVEEIAAVIESKMTVPINYTFLRNRPLPLDTKKIIPEYV